MDAVNYRNLLGWLGIFLFGMIVFEETINHLGKNSLKRILGKNTNTRIKSVITGIVETCIFQSSTIVTMMTLGFVGAGVIGLANALGVVIGANIGTTLTPWIVSLLGFKLNIEVIALPIVGVGALMTLIFSWSEKVSSFGKFLVGFGFLFLGIGYMKESVEIIAQFVSLGDYVHLSIRGFVLVGTIMTTVMQTSTGATIIILTAFNAGIITVDMALGLVIGANMWSAISTTIVGLLSSTKTQTTKKQVAFSHFLFNITTTILVTLAYPRIKKLMYLVLGPNPDPTILLALFHTTFNVILVLIRTPLVPRLIRFLHRIIPPRKTDLHLKIEHINTALPEEIINAFHQDTIYLIEQVARYDSGSLMLDPEAYKKRIEQYNTIKQVEEKLLETYIAYIKYEYTADQSQKLHTYNKIIVQAADSSKYIKEIAHHLDNIKDASLHDHIASCYAFFQQTMKMTLTTLHQWQSDSSLTSEALQPELTNILTTLHSNGDAFIGTLSATLFESSSDEVTIAEVIKSNHYLLLACESLLQSYVMWRKG